MATVTHFTLNLPLPHGRKNVEISTSMKGAGLPSIIVLHDGGTVEAPLLESFVERAARGGFSVVSVAVAEVEDVLAIVEQLRRGDFEITSPSRVGVLLLNGVVGKLWEPTVNRRVADVVTTAGESSVDDLMRFFIARLE